MYLTPTAFQECTKHATSNNYLNIGQNDLISKYQAIPWIFPEFHVCHIFPPYRKHALILITSLIMYPLCLACD